MTRLMSQRTSIVPPLPTNATVKPKTQIPILCKNTRGN
jgi:hypothetical protein